MICYSKLTKQQREGIKCVYKYQDQKQKNIVLQTLVDSGCIHTEINKQLVKERIKIEPINRLFEVFNLDRTKNGEVTRFALLEVEINRYKEWIDAAVMDLNGMDIFLGYNWLVKHNSEVNWDTETI